MRILLLILLVVFVVLPPLYSQSISAGQPVLEEYARRNQLLGNFSIDHSFSSRPITNNFRYLLSELDTLKNTYDFGILPMTSITRWNSNRPYGWGDFLMIPSAGFQQYFSSGIFFNWKFVNIQLQPEWVFAENKSFEGFSDNFSESTLWARFHYWNYGDSPELFGDGVYSRVRWGQSSIKFRVKAVELGVSTKNIWWGPGQFNSLTFSNNAQGFPHLSFNTYRPAKTFLGNFEFNILVGRLKDSGLVPSQNQDLNNKFFLPFSGDSKYLNALMVAYSPKWIKNLNFGISRTFQRYRQFEKITFRDYFPVFEGLQKINFFTNGNAVEYDSDGYDQQFTVFTRYLNIKAKAEVYFEYGRRDHALNWREFLLNPEHARAYLFGFKKLVKLPHNEKLIQVRGEVTHQQESVNRFIRYLGLSGNNSWHMHYQARGFTNYGQTLGVGVGTGSNVQTLEISLVDKFNKLGLLFERLENHQDFYYRAFGQQNENKPWIDLSMGFLFDHSWDNLLLSSKVQMIGGLNYQWQLDPKSTLDFPKGRNLFTVHSQLSLIYLFHKNNNSRND